LRARSIAKKNDKCKPNFPAIQHTLQSDFFVAMGANDVCMVAICRSQNVVFYPMMTHDKMQFHQGIKNVLFGGRVVLTGWRYQSQFYGCAHKCAAAFQGP
jgi:hypothetical protein